MDKKAILISEVKRWVGVTEIGKDNKGQLVEIWQKYVDEKAQEESWCMAFVQYHINWVDVLLYQVEGNTNFTKIFKSEHCLTVWNKTPAEYRSKIPYPGYIAIWQKENSSSGHTGVVISINPDQKTFKTIEGNTGPGVGVVRNGDGVYEKSRSMDGAGQMRLLGFINPWP